jgi:hypothetical protein
MKNKQLNRYIINNNGMKKFLFACVLIFGFSPYTNAADLGLMNGTNLSSRGMTLAILIALLSIIIITIIGMRIHSKKKYSIKKDNNLNDDVKLEETLDDNIVSESDDGNSIAETLWKDYEKEEVTADIDSLTEKKTEEKEMSETVEEEIKNEIIKDEINIEKKTTKVSDKKVCEYSWSYVIAIMIVLAGVISVAFIAGRMSVDNNVASVSKKESASAEPIVQQEDVVEVTNDNSEGDESEEEIKEADFSNTNIIVLNGGSVAGAAGDIKTLIMDNNSTVESIEAKNAVGEYADETVIYYQEEFKTEVDKIKEILNEDYGELETMTIDSLPEDEIEGNIVIVIGEK